MKRNASPPVLFIQARHCGTVHCGRCESLRDIRAEGTKSGVWTCRMEFFHWRSGKSTPRRTEPCLSAERESREILARFVAAHERAIPNRGTT